MRYVAAYLLAVLGGKASPASADLEKILGSVGIEADAEKLKKVISELNGKSIDEVIAQGKGPFFPCVLRFETSFSDDFNHTIFRLKNVMHNF